MHYAGRVTEVTDTVRPVLARVATLFRDSPAPEHSFSVHAICAAGGLVAGKWMGPSPICRALQALADSNLAGALRVVTLQSRGGVPCLDPDQCAPLCSPVHCAHAWRSLWTAGHCWLCDCTAVTAVCGPLSWTSLSEPLVFSHCPGSVRIEACARSDVFIPLVLLSISSCCLHSSPRPSLQTVR